MTINERLVNEARCPGCSGEAEAVIYRNIRVDRCKACGGLFGPLPSISVYRDIVSDVWATDFDEQRHGPSRYFDFMIRGWGRVHGWFVDSIEWPGGRITQIG